MLRARILLVVLSLPVVAPAADWTSISRYSGMHLELDTSSFVPEGNAVLAWDRMSYSADRQGVESGDIAFRSARTLMRYDCLRRTVVPVLRSFSHEDGTEILSQNVEGAELPQTIVPDTPRERMFRIVCKGRPAKALVAAAAPGGARDAAKPAKAGGPSSDQSAKPKEEGAAAAGKGKDATAKAPDGKAAEAKPATTKSGDPKVANATPGDAKAPPAKPSDAKVASAPAAAKAEGGKAPAGDAAHAKPAAADAHAKPGAPAKAGDPNARADPHAKAGPGKEEGHGATQAAKADAPGHGASDPARGDAQKEKAHTVHWAYNGQTGAQNWHKLSRDYAACAEGKRQSPIDIKEGVRVQLDALKFDYKPSALKVINNGHTIQVAYEAGSSVIVGDTPYELVQFHFHRPAEERVNGRVFDMVAHLVHKSKDGQLAVVAVLLMIGDENPFIRTLWNYLPLDVGLEENIGSVKIDVTQLLPKIRGYYTYMGSLTTPPCTEGVRWIVMRTPVQVSRAQVATFGRLYDMNARPLQASNGRLIKEVL
ncbi:MAG: carbonic anhydrase family protein [Burkholderiales bacterium]